MNHAAPLTPDDPRLLALALGEIIDPAERASLEALVAGSPDLRAAYEAHRNLAGDLRAAFATEPVPFVNPATIVAKATGEAAPSRPERRRTSGLGGSLVGTRSSKSDTNRWIAFGGVAAAAAACVAIFLSVRSPQGATSAVAGNNPVAPTGLTFRVPSSRPDFSTLALAMPGLSGAGNDFRPAGRAPLALSAPNARAYAAAFTRELADGRRPADTRIRLDGLVNAFIAARPIAPGAKPVLLETALTDAPWNPAHRILRVTVRAQGAPGEVVAMNAAAAVDFDAVSVKSWRVLGHKGTVAAPTTVALRGGETVTTLYEIEPTAASGSAPLVNIAVRYARADKSGADVAMATLTEENRKALADTDSDTRFAAGLAAYAMNLGENPVSGLALAAGDDAERRAFAALAR
jgi:hypothetical protein